jgi:hypothetical protein
MKRVVVAHHHLAITTLPAALTAMRNVAARREASAANPEVAVPPLATCVRLWFLTSPSGITIGLRNRPAGRQAGTSSRQ